MNKAKAYAEQFGCELVSTIFETIHDDLLWKCKKHSEISIERNLNLINLYKFICHTCNGSIDTKRLGYERIEQHAAKVDLKITKYVPYENSIETLIPVECKTCGRQFETIVHNMIAGRGCKPCGIARGKDVFRKTIKDVVAFASAKGGIIFHEHRVPYVNGKTKYLTYCTNGHWWNCTWNSLKNGHWCKYCVPHKFSIEEVRDILEKKGFTLVSEHYENQYEPIRMICANRHKLYKEFALVRHRRGCMECYQPERGMKFWLGLEDYQEAAKQKGYECLEDKDPSNTQTLVKWKCQKDHVWETKYSNFVYNDTGCPKCAASANRSKMERKLFDLLRKMGIEFTEQKTFEDLKDIRFLSYDFFVAEYRVGNKIVRILIEADGKQHYYIIEYFGGEKSFEKQKKHDQMKEKYCIRNNIALIRVKYDENVENALRRGLENVRKEARNGKNYVQRIQLEDELLMYH